jgi:hypothetical protein
MTEMIVENITLGQLIDALERAEPDAIVALDWGGLYPGPFGSYRGIYADLAMDFRKDIPTKVSKMLEYCQEADGGVYQGWKGGDFPMDRNSEIWVAYSGNASKTALIAIRNESWGGVTLVTRTNG